jgi:hypothetical protein
VERFPDDWRVVLMMTKEVKVLVVWLRRNFLYAKRVSLLHRQPTVGSIITFLEAADSQGLRSLWPDARAQLIRFWP